VGASTRSFNANFGAVAGIAAPGAGQSDLYRQGRTQQYAGRLHREHAGKQDVRIYDYVESDQPQLARMWEKRQRGYRAMGYQIKMDSPIAQEP